MSDDLKTLISTMAGAIQDLQIDTKANVRDLQMMTARMTHMDETLSKLGSTVAGIGTIIERLFADQDKERQRVSSIESENASLQQTVADLVKRVEALERKAS